MANEHAVASFLVGLALLLLVARVFGELARRVHLPAVAGELLAGVIVGPTVLGRIAPGSVAVLFPEGVAASMLSGFTVLSSVLLLTIAGLEIDLSVVLRRGREAALTSFLGIALPLALGVGLGLALPDRHLVDPGSRPLFAAFVGVALSISAMPVIAKTLLDLGFFRTDVGLVVMAAAMVDDLFGWMLFSVLVAPMHARAVSPGSIAIHVASALGFALVVVGVGRRLFDRLLGALERDRMSAPGRVLSLLLVVSIACAAATQALGIHAVFGAFLASVAMGDSARLRAETRARVHEFVSNVFAPVFFATIGIRVDFVGSFDLGLVASVVAVACVAKVVGCSFGARLGGMTWRESWSVGFAMNSRGAMEILLALVALDAGLIRASMFVALVVMAITTSLLSGPTMSRLLRRGETKLRSLLEQGAVVPELRARTAEQAIRELAHGVASGTPLDGSALAEEAVEASADAPAGFGEGVALARVRLTGVNRPMLAIGRSTTGIDFDAPDGEPARLVFLLVLPHEAREKAIEVEAAIVRAVLTPEQRAGLLLATNRSELLDAVDRAESAIPPSSRPVPMAPPRHVT